jgi:hypothetical protein
MGYSKKLYVLGGYKYIIAECLNNTIRTFDKIYIYYMAKLYNVYMLCYILHIYANKMHARRAFYF